MPAGAMDYLEFAQKIKTKYPQYNDMDDRELAEKIVAKYPQYSDVNFEGKTTAQPTTSGDIPEEESAASKIFKGLTPEQTKRAEQAVTETKESGLYKTLRGLAMGFGTGATLGMAKLIPSFRKEAEEAQAAAPFAYGAGELSSYAIPGTGAAKAYKLGGKAVAKMGAKTLTGKALKSGTQAAIGGAITEGVKGATEEGKIDIVEGAKKAAIAAPVEFITAGTMELLSPALKKAAGKMYNKFLKPKEKQLAKGFNADNIVNYNLEGITYRQSLDKAQKMIDNADNKLTTIIDDFVKANPDKKISSDDVFISLIEDIDSGKFKELFGEEKQAIALIDNLYTSAEKRNLTGDIAADKIRELKSLIGKKAFEKTRAITSEDVTKRKAAKQLYISFLDKLNGILPETAAEQNKIMADLIPVTSVLDNKRLDKNNIISLSDVVLFSGGLAGSSSGVVSPAVATGIVAGKKILGGGRGIGLTSLAGKGLQTKTAQRTAAGLAGKQSGRLRLSKEEEDALGKKRFGGRRR